MSSQAPLRSSSPVRSFRRTNRLSSALRLGRRSVGLLVVAVLQGAAAGQTDFTWPQLEVEASRWPTTVASGTPFDALEPGYASDDLRVDADVLALRAGELVLLHQFLRFDGVVPVASGVTDALIVPDAAGGRDVILAADASGLRSFRWDPSGTGTFLTAVEGSAAWSQATALAFDGVDTVYGVDATGDQVLRLSWSGGAGTDLAAIPTDDLLEVLPIEWDGQGSEELALRTSTTLSIVDPAAPTAPLFQAPLGDAADRIAVSRGDHGGRDQLLWSIRIDPSNNYLAYGNASGWSETLALGALQVDSLDALTFDWRDGRLPFGQDVTIGNAALGRAWLLRRSQDLTLASFDPPTGSPYTFDQYRGVAEPQGLPARSFDMDGDGDLDLLFAQSGAGLVALRDHQGVDRHEDVPLLLNGAFDTSDSSTWTWTFDLLDIAPAPATHLQVEIWPAASLGAERPALGCGRWNVDLDAGQAVIPFDATTLTSVSVLEVHVRAVTLADDGVTVLDRFPEAVGFWSADVTTMDAISLLPEVLPYGSYCPGCEGGDPLQGSGIILGGQGQGSSGFPPPMQ